jgi:hypothetical protein
MTGGTCVRRTCRSGNARIRRTRSSRLPDWVVRTLLPAGQLLEARIVEADATIRAEVGLGSKHGNGQRPCNGLSESDRASRALDPERRNNGAAERQHAGENDQGIPDSRGRRGGHGEPRAQADPHGPSNAPGEIVANALVHTLRMLTPVTAAARVTEVTLGRNARSAPIQAHPCGSNPRGLAHYGPNLGALPRAPEEVALLPGHHRTPS